MKTRLWLCALICMVLISPQSAVAQTPPPSLIKYGDVIADKFTAEQTRFEYQFEAEEGDLVVVTADVVILGYMPVSYASFNISIVDKEGVIIDTGNASGLPEIFGPRRTPRLFGQLNEGIYTIVVENTSYIESEPIEYGFVASLDRAPRLNLDEPITGETTLSMTEYVDFGWEDGFYLFSVPDDGYFDLRFQISTTLRRIIYIYDTTTDGLYVSTEIGFGTLSNQTFAGILTFQLVADHLYVVILTTQYYHVNEFRPLTYKIELSATPADR